MITVIIKTSGDNWINSQEVIERLASIDAVTPVLFETNAEGICLAAGGILAVVDRWVADTQRDPSTVTFNSPNTYEKTQYKNIYEDNHNHFLAFSKHYDVEIPAADPDAVLFGLFVGRYTSERDAMVADVLDTFPTNFLLSVMRSRYAAIPWSQRVYDVGSLDSKLVHEQYDVTQNTNASLLKFYNRFQIEVAAETMIQGTTFFPTEKTFRPVLAKKPCLIFGPTNFLANLRELGFKTYSDAWDESYDQYSGMTRWSKMKQTIADIIAHGYNQDLVREIAEFNSQHLRRWHQYSNPRTAPQPGEPGYNNDH